MQEVISFESLSKGTSLFYIFQNIRSALDHSKKYNFCIFNTNGLQHSATQPKIAVENYFNLIHIFCKKKKKYNKNNKIHHPIGLF